jgi:carboxypeptidase family protein
MKKRIIIGVFSLAAVLAGVTSAFAQADVASATIKGSVTDQNKAVVVGAIVTAKSIDRGITRTGKSDSDGTYVIPTLQPGTYEVRIEAQGFEAAVIPQAEITVGQIAVYDVELQPGGVKAQIEITGDAPVIEVERTQQSNTINNLQIENLPNIGRDFTAYVFTLPGVSSSNIPRAQNPGFTFGTSGFSIGGSNGRNNLITIDGGENEYGSGQVRYFPSIEAVQEFQVNRNAFAAEFGFTAGTAVNVITKSGTNNFHGSGYVFYRSQKIAKRQFFNVGEKKAFDQQIYPGFTFGGPIKKNKLFFFTSYEHLKSDTARFRDYLSNPLLNPTTNQVTYLNLLAASPSANTRRIGSELRATLTTTGDRYPNTLKLLTDSTGNFTAADRLNSSTTRIDYQASERDSINARFSISRNETDNLLGGGATTAVSTTATLPTEDQTIVGTWTHNFGSRIVNQARVQIVPNNSARTIPKAPGTTSLILPGVGSFGRDFATPFNTFQDRYQFEDTVSWAVNRHNVKFGASYRHVNYEVINELWFAGEWTFSPDRFPAILAVPAADRPAFAGFNIANGFPVNGPPTANFSSLQAFNLNLPFLYRQGFNNPRWQDTASYLGMFVQDSWKVVPRLTIDFGVRLDYDREPEPLQHNTYFSPRFGFAWDVTGDAKTVIRGGGGIFYSPVYYQVAYVTNLLNDSGEFINQIFRTPATLPQTPALIWNAGLAIGLPFKALTEADLNALGVNTGQGNVGRVVFSADPNYKNNYSIQASLGISRQLMSDLSLDLAYQMYRGVHIQMSQEVNFVESTLPCTPTSTLPACRNPDGFGPAFAPIDPTKIQDNVYKSIGNSIYHGMTVSLRKRFNDHFQFDANYTLSKAIDDQTDFNSAFSAFLPTRLDHDRAVSAFDVRHNFVFNAVIQTPFKAGAGHDAFERAFADISISPIVQLRSAIPFTIRIGSDTNGDNHGVYDRPFRASRNTGRGDKFLNTSLRVSKQFYINREKGVRFEFITEFTNLFNRTNFLSVNDVFGVNTPFLFGPFDVRGSRDIAPTSPLGFNSALPAFQAQFGLKFAF